MISIGTLFSGVGTPEQALKEKNIKFKSLFACEIDELARKTFLYNHDTETFYKDVYDIDGYKYKNKINILIGGSPCQPFSLSGLRKGIKEKRGTLIYEYHCLVKEINPDCFIYENVKGFTSIEKGKTFKDFLQSFIDLGYSVFFQILNTADYNLPQNRERIYIIGFKNKVEFEFPKKEKLLMSLEDLLFKNVDSAYYLSYSLEQKEKRFISCASRGRYNEDGTIEQKLEFRKDYISNTITTVQKDCYIYDGYNNKVRKLLPLEAFKLQGFNNLKFDPSVKKTNLIKQAGNAMSLNVLDRLFSSILKFI